MLRSNLHCTATDGLLSQVWLVTKILFAGPIVMLTGGQIPGSAGGYNYAPIFFSLDPTKPVPACLSGTKNPIDGDWRFNPAMLKTQGKITLINMI